MHVVENKLALHQTAAARIGVRELGAIPEHRDVVLLKRILQRVHLVDEQVPDVDPRLGRGEVPHIGRVVVGVFGGVLGHAQCAQGIGVGIVNRLLVQPGRKASVSRRA